MKINIIKHISRLTATAEQLASEYKHKGMERHLAWDQFVKDRNLKPEMPAKAFYNLFDVAYPSPLDQLVEVDFEATHMDHIADPAVPVQIIRVSGGYNMLWVNGMHGFNPDSCPPDESRFTEL